MSYLSAPRRTYNRKASEMITHHSMPSLLKRVKSLFAPQHDKKREIPFALAEKDDYLATHVELPSLAPARSRRALRRYEYDYSSVSPVTATPVFPAVCIYCGRCGLRSISRFVVLSVCFLKLKTVLLLRMG